MTSISVDGGTLTLELKQSHLFKVGDIAVITIDGKPDRWLVVTVHSPTKFSGIQDRRPRNQRRLDKNKLRKMGL